MLVKDMEIGKLYRPSKEACYFECDPIYRDDVPKGLIMISLWKYKWPIKDELYRPTMIYLGWTRENYRLHYSSKYHWFLCNGLRMAFCNYSFQHLEKIDEDV